MAVVDKKAVTRTVSDAQESTKEKGEQKGRVVDVLTDINLPTGEVHKLDPTEDAWAFSAPPKAGRYTIKCVLAKDGVRVFDDDKTKEPGYGIAMEARIINSPNGEFDNVMVFPRASTFLGRGKNISTAAALISKFGKKLPSEEANQLQVAQWLVKTLKGEPTCDVELDWRGYSSELKRVVARNMEAFPKDAEGNPLHIYDYKHADGHLEEIKAQLDVVHWYSKGEASKPGHGAGKPTAGQGKPAAASVMLTPTDEDNELEEAPKPTAGGKGSKPATVAPVSDADLLADLEDE